jgi:hypothetical protein
MRSSGKAAGHATEHKRDADGRPGILRGGVSGQDKDAGTDDGTDAQRDRLWP